MVQKVVFRLFDEADETYTTESIWATKYGVHYKLENIPFYAYLFSYGDIVEVEESDGILCVKGLVQASGNSTIRLLFSDLSTLNSVKIKLKELGCDSESSEEVKLLSMDVPHSVSYKMVRELLEAGVNDKLFDYEEASISELHQREI